MTAGEGRVPRPGYERADMSVRGVVAVLGGFALLVAVAVASIGLGLHVLAKEDVATQRPITPQQKTVLVPPGPKLQALPYDDLHAAQAHETALLESYAWANAAHSAARIPIARAMALVAGRSLDAGVQGVAP